MSVLVGPGALQANGLVVWYGNVASLTTHLPELHREDVIGDVLFYFPDVHGDHSEVRRYTQTRYALAAVPTPERALIDYIRHLDDLEEIYLVEGLRDYVAHHNDLSHLREIAAHYDATEALEYWLEDIKDTSDLE